jgi:hypothetical protein
VERVTGIEPALFIGNRVNPLKFSLERQDGKVTEDTESRKGPALDRVVGNVANTGVAAALLYAGLSSDAAAAIAGLAGPIVEELSFGFRRRATLRSERLQRFFKFSIEDQELTVEELLHELMYDDLKLELLARAVEAAADTISEIRLRLLAQAFVTGALAADRATVDQGILIVEALSQLEAAHFRVLAILRTEAPPHFDVEGTPIEGEPAAELRRSWSEAQLAERDPGLAAAISPLVARLNTVGMLHDEGRGRLGNVVPMWTLNAFGRACSDELDRLGQTPET